MVTRILVNKNDNTYMPQKRVLFMFWVNLLHFAHPHKDSATNVAMYYSSSKIVKFKYK